MAQTNLEILDELEMDLIDCAKSAHVLNEDISGDEDEMTLVLFQELRKVKNNNKVVEYMNTLGIGK